MEKPATAWVWGKAYFIRTATYHYVGRVTAVRDNLLELEDASWVADSGRWNNALKTGQLVEVEPYPFGVAINIDAIVDVSPWHHNLPKETL